MSLAQTREIITSMDHTSIWCTEYMYVVICDVELPDVV